MFVINLLRWLRGTVTFLVTGSFPERLFNLCLRTGLPVWGITPLGWGYRASTYAQHYRRLRPLAKKSGARVRIEHKTGWPFVRHRYRHRWGIALGAALAAMLMLLLPTRIWSIEVIGCEEMTQEEVLEALGEMGLTVGVKAHDVDVRELERRMLLADDRIAWITINIITSTAQIELRERVAPPKRLDPKEGAANVVAEADGQIIRLEVYEGQAMVRVGDTVKKGQVIVSGVMQDGHGNTRLVWARAKIIAQTYEVEQVEVPLAQSVLEPAGPTKVTWELRLSGRRIGLPFAGQADEESPHSMSVQTTLLLRRPRVEWVAIRRTPLAWKNVFLSEFEAKELAMRQLEALTPVRGDETRIYGREVTAQMEDDCYRIIRRTLVEKDIAEEAEILLS